MSHFIVNSYVYGSATPELELIDNDFSMEFNGTDEYMTFETITLGVNCTISIWVNLDPSYTGVLMGGIPPSAPSSYTIYMVNGNTFYLALDGIARNYTVAGGIISGNAGSWQHICVVRTADTDLEIFVNGVSVQTFTLSSGDPTTINSLGATSSGTYPIKTDIDEVAAWTRALDATEVETIYDSTNDNPGKCANLFTGGLGTDLVFWNRMGD